MKFIIYLILLFFSSMSLAVNLDDVIVSSEIYKNKNIFLKLTLYNDSSADVFFDEGFMSRRNLVLLLVKAKSYNNQLEENYYFDDPPILEVMIPNGKEYSNSIDLNDLYPTLEQDLKERDVIVFWSLNLKPLYTQSEKRFGGYLVISRNSFLANEK